VYWLGEMVSLVTQGGLHNSIFAWVPNGGYVSLTQNPWQWALAPHLSLAHVGESLRGNLRPSVARRIDQQYERGLTFARPSQRLSERRILYRHALRCSLISIVSLFGLDVGVLVGGAALLTEVVFAFRSRMAHLPGTAKPRLAAHHGLCHVRRVLRGPRERRRRRDLRLTSIQGFALFA